MRVVNWFKRVDSHIWIALIYLIVGMIAGCNVYVFREGRVLKEEEKSCASQIDWKHYTEMEWEPIEILPTEKSKNRW